MYILGISAYYHDSAACLIKNGEIISAVQEERFTRKKHDFRFPKRAIEYCLKSNGITGEDLAYVAFYDKPFIKFERLLETYLAYAPMGIRSFWKAVPVWIKQKIWIRDLIRKELEYSGKIIFPEHHESHAASAFFPSPFKNAAFLTTDGVGEWTTTSFGKGGDNQIQILREIHFPHSLGLLYSAFTYYTGFKVNSGEYKLMGLAPYGEPKYINEILDHLIDVKEDGSYRLNMAYFNYCVGLTMTNEKFNRLFGGPPRKPESELTQKQMDLAKSIQVVTEDILLKTTLHIHRVTGEENLCMAGGVALNCVANGRILREGPFKKIWVQPAAGDAGGALGAALFTWHQYLDNERNADNINDYQKGSYLGPAYSSSEVKHYLDKNNAVYQELAYDDIPEIAAGAIAQGKVIGWFQGAMEYGPRALGARSIIGDARSPEMQTIMNLKIKFRESFRPFAPSVIGEYAPDYFDADQDSPYMLFVAHIKNEKRINHQEINADLWGLDKLKINRSEIPAITHVDYSARLQTVHEKTNPLYYRMIKSFKKLTGCPVIVNTSFNVRGEPIVCSPENAYICFMRTDMDYLVIENFLLAKSDQPYLDDRVDWRNEFELD